MTKQVVEFIPTEPLRIQVHHGDKITAEDAARALGVKRTTICDMQQRGSLGCFKLAGKVFVPKADVERLLVEGENFVKGPRRSRAVQRRLVAELEMQRERLKATAAKENATV